MGRQKKIRTEDVVKVDEVNEVSSEAVIEESVILIPKEDGWVSITVEQVKEAERLGLLIGYDPLTMTALISKGEINA
jgi:hypothetical protein